MNEGHVSGNVNGNLPFRRTEGARNKKNCKNRRCDFSCLFPFSASHPRFFGFFSCCLLTPFFVLNNSAVTSAPIQTIRFGSIPISFETDERIEEVQSK